MRLRNRRIPNLTSRGLTKHHAVMLAKYGYYYFEEFFIHENWERFFHAEFFELADGSHVALEINLRPPGGFTLDMMNYACDVDLLHRVLREEFVRIYSEPVLQNFLDQQRKAHPGIGLPDPPQTGDLDIQQVLSSPYFFA